ncbi:hypothetical protein BB560_000501, partial [Smittium megazygosporum]
MERRWPCYAEALYTFKGEDDSHLPFQKGDLIVVSECDDEDWWRGRISKTSRFGLFPSCLVYPTGEVVDDYDYDIERKTNYDSLSNAYQSRTFSDFQNNPSSIRSSALRQKLSSQYPQTPSIISQNFDTLNNLEQLDDSELQDQLLNMANNEIEFLDQIKNPPVSSIKLKMLYKEPKKPSYSSSTLNYSYTKPTSKNHRKPNPDLSSESFADPSAVDEFVKQYMERDGMVEKYFLDNYKVASNNSSVVQSSPSIRSKKSNIPSNLQNNVIKTKLVKNSQTNASASDLSKPPIHASLLTAPNKPSSSVASIIYQPSLSYKSSVSSSSSSTQSSANYRQYLLDSGLDKLSEIQRKNSVSATHSSDPNPPQHSQNKLSMLERYKSLKRERTKLFSSNPSIDSGKFGLESSSKMPKSRLNSSAEDMEKTNTNYSYAIDSGLSTSSRSSITSPKNEALELLESLTIQENDPKSNDSMSFSQSNIFEIDSDSDIEIGTNHISHSNSRIKPSPLSTTSSQSAPYQQSNQNSFPNLHPGDPTETNHLTPVLSSNRSLKSATPIYSTPPNPIPVEKTTSNNTSEFSSDIDSDDLDFGFSSYDLENADSALLQNISSIVNETPYSTVRGTIRLDKAESIEELDTADTTFSRPNQAIKGPRQMSNPDPPPAANLASQPSSLAKVQNPPTTPSFRPDPPLLAERPMSVQSRPNNSVLPNTQNQGPYSNPTGQLNPSINPTPSPVPQNFSNTIRSNRSSAKKLPATPTSRNNTPNKLNYPVLNTNGLPNVNQTPKSFSQNQRKPPPPVPPRLWNTAYSVSPGNASNMSTNPNEYSRQAATQIPFSISPAFNNRNPVPPNGMISPAPNHHQHNLPYAHNVPSPVRVNSSVSNYYSSSPSKLSSNMGTSTPTPVPTPVSGNLINIPFSTAISNSHNGPPPQTQNKEIVMGVPNGLGMQVYRNPGTINGYNQSTLVGGGAKNDFGGRFSRERNFSLRSNNTDTNTDLIYACNTFTPFPSNIGTDQAPSMLMHDFSSLKTSNSINSISSANQMNRTTSSRDVYSNIPESIYGILPGMIKIGFHFTRSQVVQVDDLILGAPIPYGVSALQFVRNAKQVVKPGAKITKMDEYNWEEVDKAVESLNSTISSAKVSLESIAKRYIGHRYNNQPHLMVRAIFVWVTSLISFEEVDTNSGNRDGLRLHLNEMPDLVYERKKSTGPGFAYLFQKVSTLLNIESYVVHGTLKLPAPYPDSFLSGPVRPTLPNHAWNVVCIDGEYRFIDCACAAISHPLNENGYRDDGFFLARPNNFIYTHFPHDPKMQYLSPFISWSIFWNLPCTRPAFFRDGIKLLNLTAPYISIQDDTMLPLIMCLKDDSLSCFAEVVMFENYSNQTSQLPVFPKISKIHPLFSQCMNYEKKRMAKVLVGANSTDNKGVIKIYSGIKPSLLTKSAQVELLNIMSEREREKFEQQNPEAENSELVGRTLSRKSSKSSFISNTFSKRSRSNSALSLSSMQFTTPKQTIKGIFKHKRVRSETKLKQDEIFQSPYVLGAPNDKTYNLALTLPLHHLGSACNHEFVLTNHFSKDEFYIKNPTTRMIYQGTSVDFHIIPSSTVSKHYKIQLKSPSGYPTKFIFQPNDHTYTLTHTVREVGCWAISYHSDTEGWVPIVMYQ